MKTNLKSNIKRALTVATTIIGLSVFYAGTANAWGPERPTFTMENPATYPTFNAITDNPTIVDERNFVRVGEINADVTDLGNEVEVIPGKQYLVYIYFHNDASAQYNKPEYNRSGIAMRTRMSSSFSTVLTPSERGTVTGTITADNSNPLSVWDEAYLTTSTDKVLLHYVPGSAKIYNDWGANGSVMPSSLFTEEGTLIGLNALNGVIPGCEEYHGVVSYVLGAEELGGSIAKEISTDGVNYGPSAEINPGDEAYFRLTIENTGDVELTNATIKDNMPEGLSLVPGSTELMANDSGTKDLLSDDIATNGFNLGTVGTGNKVVITYRAKANDDFDCNGLSFSNTASLTYDSETSAGDTKMSTANIVIKKSDCESVLPPPCTADPTLPGCAPEEELPKEIVSTGPVEIILAVVVVLAIAGAGFYLYRTKRVLKTVEGEVSGKTTTETKDTKGIKDAKGTTSTTEPKNHEGPQTPETPKE